MHSLDLLRGVIGKQKQRNLVWKKKIVQAIQTYVDTKIEKCKQEIARNNLKKQEHIAQCLIYRSVYVVEEIQSINVEKIGNMEFTDFHVYDWNGEKVIFEKMDIQRGQNFYMEVVFQCKVSFKYIEFIG